MPATARRLIIALLCTAAASGLVAQAPPAIAAFVPATPDAAHVFVLDSAHILSAGTIAALQDSARALQAETGADVAWVTLPTLGGRAVEEAALYIGRTWRIGTPGNPGDPMRNRGLVVLYVPDKTKTVGPNFRIEVGKGLEGTITDSRSRSITTAMRDGLTAKTYDEAYLAGWTAAAALVREDFAAHVVTPPATTVPSGSKSRSGSAAAVVAVIVLCLVAGLFIFIVAIVRGRRRRAASPTMRFARRQDDDDDVQRRRGVWIAPTTDDSSSSSAASSDDSSSSSGGDFGGGGGFDGGGSSDSI